jgi:uncharacterized surface anchored protein
MKFLISIILCFLVVSAFSQGTTNKSDVGLIIGNVIDADGGAAVAGATILLSKKEDSLFRRQLVTDKNGSFEIESIPFGIYRISLSSVGFATFVLDSINIRL